MLPIPWYKNKARCGKLTAEYYADHYTDAKQVVQNLAVSM